MCDYCYVSGGMSGCPCSPCQSLSPFGEAGEAAIKAVWDSGANREHGVAVGYCLTCEHAQQVD